MKFAIVLPSWIYNEVRHALATEAFKSLLKTKMPSEEARLLIVSKQVHWPFDGLMSNRPGQAFFTSLHFQPEGVGGTEQTLAWGTEEAFSDVSITHVIWMGDDALFHPDWLIELEALIGRHPEARAWSVYRSAHERFHKPLVIDRGDVLVSSICGHGMTFSREEWKEWGVHWSQGQAWPNPYAGNTLDLHHPWKRPGERWVTEKSYVQHTGRVGLHCTPDIPEYAQQFVGVGE